MLLECVATINLCNEAGHSTLSLACERGHLDATMQELLAALGTCNVPLSWAAQGKVAPPYLPLPPAARPGSWNPAGTGVGWPVGLGARLKGGSMELLGCPEAGWPCWLAGWGSSGRALVRSPPRVRPSPRAQEASWPLGRHAQPESSIAMRGSHTPRVTPVSGRAALPGWQTGRVAPGKEKPLARRQGAHAGQKDQARLTSLPPANLSLHGSPACPPPAILPSLPSER